MTQFPGDQPQGQDDDNEADVDSLFGSDLEDELGKQGFADSTPEQLPDLAQGNPSQDQSQSIGADPQLLQQVQQVQQAAQLAQLQGHHASGRGQGNMQVGGRDMQTPTRGLPTRGRGQSQFTRGGVFGQQLRTRDRQDAILWSDILGFRTPRYDYARQHFPLSFDSAGTYEFYLNGQDSAAFQAHISQNPHLFPDHAPPPRPVHSQGQSPRQTQNPQNQSPPDRRRVQGAPQPGQQHQPMTHSLSGAVLWTDNPIGIGRPFFEYATGRYPSLEEHHRNTFYLDVQDSVNFCAYILQNPNNFPPVLIPPVAAQPLPGQIQNLAAFVQQLQSLHSQNIPVQELYASPAVHDSQEQCRYGIQYNVNPRQYGQNYQGPWQGPPMDRVNQEIGMTSNTPEPGVQGSAQRPIRLGGRNRPAREDAPFDGPLEDHPEWWGSFIDDGPQKPDEPARHYTSRITKARINMQIETRPTKAPIEPQQPGQSTADRKQQISDYKQLHLCLNSEHMNRMNPNSMHYDGKYVNQWGRDKAARKARNDVKRQEELAYVRNEYSRAGLQPPPTPDPPEDSSDELYHRTGPPSARPARKDSEEDDDNDQDSQDDQEDGNWDDDPDLYDEYRENYPNNEHMRCVFCMSRKKRCTFAEKRFPCDRCTEARVKCVRQFWKPEGVRTRNAPKGGTTGPPLYLPSRIVRQQCAQGGVPAPNARKRGDSNPVTGVQGRPTNAAAAVRAATTIAALNEGRHRPERARPDARCYNCQQEDRLCQLSRPCTYCRSSGKVCEATIQGQTFRENEPQDGRGDYELDPTFGDNIGALPMTNPQLLTTLFTQFPQIGAAARNIAASIAVGTLPSAPPRMPSHQAASANPPPSRPGGLTLPTIPRADEWVTGPDGIMGRVGTDSSLKRGALDDDDEDDGSASDVLPHRPRKQLRTEKQRGTTAAQEAANAARAGAQSQTNQYDPANNSRLDPQNPTGGDGDDPMVLDDGDGCARQMGRRQYPRQPQAPRASQMGFPVPSWKIWGLPVKPSVSSTSSGGTTDNTQRCVQDINYWAQGAASYCGRTPAKGCDELSDGAGWTDRICHDEQDARVRHHEAAAIDKSKLFCCITCYQNIQTSLETPNLHLQFCQCSWQMSRTWLCNPHRVKARRDFEAHVGIQLEAYLMNNGLYGNQTLCPVCRIKPGLPGNNAWQCVSCEAYVFRNPLAV